MLETNPQGSAPEEREAATNANSAPEGEKKVSDAEGQDAGEQAAILEAQKQEEAKKESRFQRAQRRAEEELRKKDQEIEFLRNLAKNGTAPAAKASNVDPEEPKIEDFAGKPISEYIAARDTHREKSLVEKVRAQTQAEMQRAEIEKQFNQRIDDARKELPDWQEVMDAAKEDQIFPPQDVVNFIIESELGPKIAYHLAKNPQEIDRLEKLSPTRRAAELGKLEDKLDTKKVVKEEKKTSGAPAKLTDVKGGSNFGADPAVAARQGYEAWKAADAARKAAKPAAKKR